MRAYLPSRGDERPSGTASRLSSSTDSGVAMRHSSSARDSGSPDRRSSAVATESIVGTGSTRSSASGRPISSNSATKKRSSPATPS